MYELTLDAQPFSVDKCWFMNHGKPIALSAKDKWACSEIAGTFTPVGPVKSGVTHDAILTLGMFFLLSSLRLWGGGGWVENGVG